MSSSMVWPVSGLVYGIATMALLLVGTPVALIVWGVVARHG